MAFNSLPQELNRLIADFIEEDKDLVSFSKICRETYQAVFAVNSTVLPNRFKRTFDVGEGTKFVDMADIYQKRRRTLSKAAKCKFLTGYGKAEYKILQTIKSLIIESSSKIESISKNSSRTYSLNHTHLQDLVRTTSLTTNIFAGKYHYDDDICQLLQKIQLCLTPWSINSGQNVNKHGVSQEIVYGHFEDYRLFVGAAKDLVVMEWFLHCAQFFKHFMTKRDEDIGIAYQALMESKSTKDYTIQPWNRKTYDATTTLGKYWKSTYAFVDVEQLMLLRSEDSDAVVIENQFENSPTFQDFEIHPTRDEHIDPSSSERFERELDRFEYATNKKPFSQYFFTRFFALGTEKGRTAAFKGRLYRVDSLCEIGAWYRVVMLKYFLPDHITPHIDTDNIWLYEGLMLPGGNIMLGRWLFPDVFENLSWCEYSGPFMIWNVSGTDEKDQLSFTILTARDPVAF